MPINMPIIYMPNTYRQTDICNFRVTSLLKTLNNALKKL